MKGTLGGMCGLSGRPDPGGCTKRRADHYGRLSLSFVQLSDFLNNRVALLAELCDEALVFTDIVHAPLGGWYDEGEAQYGAEYQHERDGEGEDQSHMQ